MQNSHTHAPSAAFFEDPHPKKNGWWSTGGSAPLYFRCLKWKDKIFP